MRLADLITEEDLLAFQQELDGQSEAYIVQDLERIRSDPQVQGFERIAKRWSAVVAARGGHEAGGWYFAGIITVLHALDEILQRKYPDSTIPRA